jgi:HPr kinase/phosphorylase
MDTIQIHGVLVQVYGMGALILGESGSGKSMAALGLMDRGHKLVADDLVKLRKGHDGGITGSAVSPEVKVEIRGLGVFPVESLIPDRVVTSTSVDVVIQLESYDRFQDAGRLAPDTGTEIILGVETLRVRIPVVNAAQTPLLIELLVKRLKDTGGL